MANFFERLFGRATASSANAAKERLQLVLIHDRTDISQAVMDQIKDEIIAVISKHVNIDRTGVDVNLSQINRQNKLVVNIPLLAAVTGGGRRRRR
jgi:cell division topological specificity factor